ncbi:MAG: cyclodeaminase/cyclohydrolase family protein, partial [Candidatus Cloacimonas sp.]|nr:cyclodeaminase/cyclohydrolase family protein [Candidatus Cloacimonas sp.]
TIAKKGYETVQEEALAIAPIGQEIKLKAMECIDRDTDAFYTMMDAMRLPKKTETEISYRNEQIELSTRGAILSPLETLRLSHEALLLSARIAKIGNSNALSDAGVAALTALCAAKAANYNILINIAGITNASFKQQTLSEAAVLIDKCEAIAEQVECAILAKLS